MRSSVIYFIGFAKGKIGGKSESIIELRIFQDHRINETKSREQQTKAPDAHMAPH